MEKSCETENGPKTFRELIKTARFWKPVSGILIGGLLGFLYYYYAGCSSGTCAITGNPIMSTLFGSAMGFFVVSRPCSSC